MPRIRNNLSLNDAFNDFILAKRAQGVSEKTITT